MMHEQNPYADILTLPHHKAENRPQMSMHDRAAQFSPFAALTGYEDAIRETARLTDNWVQLSEDKKQELDEKLRQLIADRERTESVTIIYFQPDDRKEGGSYVTVTGQIKKIDDCSQKIFLTDGTKIDLGRIVDIK